MKSFFSRIQSKFDASYGGRYIETILHEVTLDDDSIARFIGNSRDPCRIETEYSFTVNNTNRIADIAIFSTKSDSVIGLVEVKYDDHKVYKNSAQLKDYITYCRINGLSFTYLTQYYPPSKDVALVKEAGHRHFLFSHLSEEIKANQSSQITQLFIKYLEDKGLSMKIVDNNSLYKYLVRLFNPTSGQNKIQNNTAMVEGISDSFHALMNNISVLSQEISRYTEGKRVPVIDFRVWPYFKFSKSKLKELLDDDELERSGYLGNGEKNGGELLAFARSVIIDTSNNREDWLYLEYGYKVVVEKGDSAHSSFLYVEIYGKNIDKNIELYKEKKISNITLSNKVKCLSHLSKLIHEVSDISLQKVNSKTYRKSFDMLSRNFKEFI